MKDFAAKLALVIVAALAPIHTVMIVVGILVFADLVTGVWAAVKTQQKFSSAKLRNSVSKAILYQIAVITGFIVEQYLIGDALPVTKIVGGLIGTVEAVSVFENINKILNTNLFAVLIEKLGSSNLPKSSDKSQNETPKG
jgi:hypothetical protein